MHATLKGALVASARRWQAWWAVVALLAIACLLASFHQVVQDGVRRGDVWRQATALHGVAATRCGVLGAWPARESCLVELNAALRDDVLPHEEGAALVAQRGR